MLNAKTRVGEVVEKLRFYEWAYGRLAESDADIGAVGEYMVGRTLGCLHKARKVNDIFDLVADNGLTIEVKTTTRRVSCAGGLFYRWDIKTQLSAIEGRRELARVWIFLAAEFPDEKARVNALDTRYWTASVLTGEAVRRAGVTHYVTEKTLARCGATTVPLAQLKSLFKSRCQEPAAFLV